MTEPDVTYQESAMVAMRHMGTEVRALVDYSIRLEKSNDELSDALQTCRAKNAKLRELVQDMYGFIKRMDEECGDVTFSDCFDYCKHDTADDGCCKTGECWYERRMQELQDEIGAE